MSYRKITVDGQEYQYTIGSEFVKIKGQAPVAIADIGSQVSVDKLVVSPQHIQAYIRNIPVDHAKEAHKFLVETSVAKMNKIAKEGEQNGDYSRSHGRADQLLCDVLEQLGFHELANSYHNVGKWYE